MFLNNCNTCDTEETDPMQLALTQPGYENVPSTIKLKKQKSVCCFYIFIDIISRARERTYWTLSN